MELTPPTDSTPKSETPAAASKRIQQAWQKCGARLRAELGEDIFTSWFGRLNLESVHGKEARFSAPTRFLKSWIEAHYRDRLLTALTSELGDITSLSVTVRTAADSRLSPTAGKEKPSAEFAETAAKFSETPKPDNDAHARQSVANNDAKKSPDQFSASPLDRRLTFASFVVGRSNQMAHSAALRVAEARLGQPPAYSPLYFHASVGLGKTHLLQAIAHGATTQGRTVLYLTAERFMYGFVAALQAQSAIVFKERLRAIDLLIIDDVQFLQGKTIQTEFCHTLNALVDAGRQVVVAADRPPADLDTLDERVRSRLAGGLCVEMNGLDEPLRIKILESRIAAARLSNANFDVPAAVVAYVAKAICSNGRDLDGAVNRLVAHSHQSGAPLNVEIAEVAIRDLIRAREPKRVKIEDIQKLVASHYSVTRADILSSRRTASVVKPRQIAMYLAKALTLRSLPEIGRRFGGRDHTTVLHAVRKIEGLSQGDRALSDELDLLKRMLQE